MYHDIIKTALGGRENETLIEGDEITAKTKLIFIGEWPDKTFMAGVCENTLYDLYESFDQMADPSSIVRIWAEQQFEDISYVDTGESSVLLENWKRPQKETVTEGK
jgi:hypothetical protein